MLAEGAIKEEDAEDGWVIAETKGNDQVEDIDSREEQKEIEEEVVGDIDDEDEDENIFVQKKEVESEQVKC